MNTATAASCVVGPFPRETCCYHVLQLAVQQVHLHSQRQLQKPGNELSKQRASKQLPMASAHGSAQLQSSGRLNPMQRMRGKAAVDVGCYSRAAARRAHAVARGAQPCRPGPSPGSRLEVPESSCAPAEPLASCSDRDQGIGLPAAIIFAGLQALAAHPALAEEAVTYDASTGDALKNIAGVFYIALVVFFAYRLLVKRAKRAREERLASKPAAAAPAAAEAPPPARKQPRGRTTPAKALFAAAQAGAIAVALYLFSTKVNDTLSAWELPDQYTARQLSVGVRTIAVGLFYLATFIFGANAAGMFALGVQLALFPDSLKDDPSMAPSPGLGRAEPELPKVSYRAEPEEVRRAFERAGRADSSQSSAGQQPPSSGTPPVP